MHKTQGKSYDWLEFDVKFSITVPGLHYVALSCCRTEDGNYVIGDLHVNQILANTGVKEEMKRLREDRQFDLWRFDYAQQLESQLHAGIVVYVSESVSSVANVLANVLFGVHFSKLTIGT